jgi:hypothetical protein
MPAQQALAIPLLMNQLSQISWQIFVTGAINRDGTLARLIDKVTTITFANFQQLPSPRPLPVNPDD